MTIVRRQSQGEKERKSRRQKNKDLGGATKGADSKLEKVKTMKISPSKKELLNAPKHKNLVVLRTSFLCDYITPLSMYAQIQKLSRKESFLLESADGDEKISRFSFIGSQPLIVFKSKGNTAYLSIEGARSVFTITKDPLEEMKKLMARFSLWPKENVRFFGGFVGYLGYDTVRFFEPVGKKKIKGKETFDTYFILPKILIIYHHRKKSIELLSFAILKDRKHLAKLYDNEVSFLTKVKQRILTPLRLPLLAMPVEGSSLASRAKKEKLISNFKKEEFLKAVRKVKRYINAGEIIQLVLSQRFSLDFSGDPFLVYRYLRLLNPSPYMFYLNFQDAKIVGASPEMLLRLERGVLTTRPIAGTRKRGVDEEQDKLLAQELLRDTKEQAEHVMLVDLGRNDIGRVAEKGTVKVPIFMTIERFSHVMHIVSEVIGKIASKDDMFSALRACFPAGTVAGAPKVRAMQIIDELEPDSRGIYAGCVGYFSFTNAMDTCIIIRTIVFGKGKAYIQAGAGIVADSKPLFEYQETVNKARAQLVALSLARG